MECLPNKVRFIQKRLVDTKQAGLLKACLSLVDIFLLPVCPKMLC